MICLFHRAKSTVLGAAPYLARGTFGPRPYRVQTPTVKPANLALAVLASFVLTFAVLNSSAAVQAQAATNTPPGVCERYDRPLCAGELAGGDQSG